MATVACSSCKRLKDSTFDFYSREDKRQCYCKECAVNYSKKWAKLHKERLKACKHVSHVSRG